jgi:hypothetical protein
MISSSAMHVRAASCYLTTTSTDVLTISVCLRPSPIMRLASLVYLLLSSGLVRAQTQTVINESDFSFCLYSTVIETRIVKARVLFKK